MRISRRVSLLSLLGAGFLASVLLAQSPTGTITGTVSDPSGGVVPGAKADITNTLTGISRSATTNAAGNFQFPLLNPGTYRLTVEFTGFNKYVRDGIVLNVAEKPDVQVVLHPGAVTQQVEVTAAAPLLETNTSDVGQLVNRREIENLPLNGRSVISLQLLSNGVAPVNGINNPDGVWGSYINGGRQGASEVLYDGVANTYAENNPGTKDLVRDPPLASVEEFKLITNSMSAEYGGTTGGLFAMVSRSGTNNFHGELFEFLRNSALNATDFFTNRNGGHKQPTKKHQFGGAIGGPIRRDKTFFFFHYEGDRDRTLDNLLTTVPTARMRQGDFTETYNPNDPTTWIYNPFSLTAPYAQLAQQDPRYNRYSAKGGNSACAATVPGTTDGTVRPPFPGNIIPPQCLDPVSMAVIQYYPLPTNNKLVDNFFSGGIAGGSSGSWDVRIDHNISEKQKVYLRFGRDSSTSSNANHFKNIADPTFNPSQGHATQAVYEHTYSFSPTTLFTFRYGLSRVHPDGGVDPRLKNFHLTDLGFPKFISDYSAAQTPQYFPNFVINGYSSIGTIPWAAYRNAADSHTLETVLTKLRGRHSIKVGYTGHMYRDNESQPGIPGGYFGFYGNEYTSGPEGGGYTNGGSALADFLIGGIGWGAFSVDIANDTQSWAHAGFFQDDIKVNSKLTLNLGLRYDVAIPRTERHNRMSFWRGNVDFPIQLDPNVVSNLETQLGQSLPNLRHMTGGLGFPGSSGFSRQLYKKDWNNFGPRFGFAYRVTPQTVLRGAFGVMYGPSYAQAAGNGAGTQDGFAYTAGINTTYYSSDGHVEPLYAVASPFPFGIGAITGNTRGLATLFGEGPGNAANQQFQPLPYMLNWNFGIERELPGNILVQASYVANHSLRWAATYGLNLNQLAPAQIRAAVAKYGDSGFDSANYNNPFFDLIGPGGQYQDPGSPYFYPLVTAQQLTSRYPQFPNGASLAWPANGNSVYNSLQVRVEKRVSRGLSFLVNYTNSKFIDNGEGTWAWLGNHGKFQDVTNLKGERSLAANDVSQRLALTFQSELPFGRDRRFLSNSNRVVNAFLGGWQTSNIMFFSKGVPAIWTENSSDYNRFLAGGRPDKVCNGVNSSGSVESRLDDYFDIKCLQTPAAFGLGSAPRTDPHIRWPSSRDWDFSMMKNFPIKEKVTVQFRSEFFNFTNTPQFGFQGGNCCSLTEGTNFSDKSTFGRLRHQINSPRQIQFGLRILF